MKKTIILSLAMLLGSIGYSQRVNIESAITYFKNGEMVEAKEKIDKAFLNTETANDPRMWYFRGRIYQRIYGSSAFTKMDTEAVEKSLVGYINCINTDIKKKFEEDVDDAGNACGSAVGLVNAGFACYNEAYKAYERKDYDMAMKYADLLLRAIPVDNAKDFAKNNLTENSIILFSSQVAMAAKDNTKARQYLQKLIDRSYKEPSIYIQMEQMQLRSEDTSNALKTIEKGRELFPENGDLRNEELRIYQLKGDLTGLMDKLNKSIESEPDNVNYIITRASIFDNIKVKYIAEKKQREADSMAALAEIDYKKCVELNPNDTYALYSLGALYLLQANPIIDKINQLNEKNKDYLTKKTELSNQRKAVIMKAKPFLDKAYELQPNDKDIVNATFQMYYQLEIKDKADILRKKKADLEKKK
ncbi:MAG: hypothetical protein EXR21_04305 [Flavobacteriaceae bacterium]|nr:hypothetical protein [Flavobacteriaceae bacterium]